MVGAKPGDLIFVMSGDKEQTLKALGELRLEMGNQLGLRKKGVFKPLWVVDFPLLEWNEESQRYHAMHHPFTSPKPEDIAMLDTDPGKVRANAYDLVINGVEIGGGSVRIFNSELQAKMFDKLGFTPEQAQSQFGFLMNAFKYGAPPHGGMASGIDRLVMILQNESSIREVIAFPKTGDAQDLMMGAPSKLPQSQLNESNISIKSKISKK